METQNATEAASRVRMTRDIPVTWLVTAIVAVLLWAGSQYVSYSRMADSVVTQTKLIGDLTTQVAALGEKFDGAKMKNLEQDFLIANLKQRIEALEAVDNRAARKP